MKQKRVLAACAVFALAGMSLVGCGQNSTDSTTTGDTSAESSDGLTIEYWHRLPDSDGMIKVSEAVEEFNKTHDFTVKSTKFEGTASESYDKISNAVTAGTAPCLAQASFDGIPTMLTRGELLDVTDKAAQYKSNYTSGPWELTSPGGKTYGIPQDSGPMVYLYDKDAFDALGLTAPTTWDEYWALAAQAKAAGKYTSAYLTDDAAGWFSAVHAAAGAQWFQTSGNGWKVEIDSDISKQVDEQWQKSIDDGTTLLVKRWDETDFNTKIADGTLIGYVTAAWDAPLIFDTSGKDSANWQVAQMPDQKSGPWGGSAIVVLKGCEHPDEALEFADWYNTNLEYMASQGLVPAAKGDAPQPDWAKYYGGQDVMAEFATANDNTTTDWMYAPVWLEVQKVIVDGSAGLDSGTKLDSILSDAQKQAIESLEAAGIEVVE